MCAKIYPQKEYLEETPASEVQVYDYLSQLDDAFTVFHSVRWMKRNHKWSSTWKENDFLVLHKELGALVIEVKGGDIQYSDGVFIQKNTLTGEEQILSDMKRNDPLSQAIDGTYHYRQLISEVTQNSEGYFPVEPAVWFSSCSISEKIDSFPSVYREARGAILGKEHLMIGEKAVLNVYDFYESHRKTTVSDEDYARILDALAQDFELITAPSIRKGEISKAFLRLTNEQIGLLDYISEQNQATIQGVAGTGKTLVAKEAARRLAQDGRKVLFLCFNRMLISHLQHMYPYPNVDYYNIHGFISKYGDVTEDLSDSEYRAQALQRINWDCLQYDDVIIDEGQDFHNSEILYFENFCERQNGHFLVFYDRNQILMTKEVPTWIKESECRLILTKNCRNTYEIAQTSYNVLDVELKHSASMIHGEKTTLTFEEDDPQDGIRRLIEYFTSDDQGYVYSDITILMMKSENASILEGAVSLSGIPLTKTRTQGAVLCTTVKKFKGLESPVIIVTDIDEQAFADEEQKRLFYVACSRATHQLALFVVGDENRVKTISSTIRKGKHFAPQGVIMMKTHSQLLNV